MSSRFEQRPVLTIFMVILAVFSIVWIVAEVWLRFTVASGIGYYTAVEREGDLVFPYGVIHINSYGLPDGEFDLSDARPRIGYFGDSVVYGVGAGDGHRVSDLLEEKMPDYQHFTIGWMGKDVDDVIRLYSESRREGFDLGTVVFFLNLNDVYVYVARPSLESFEEAGAVDEVVAKENIISLIHSFFFNTLDALRGKSYAYTYVRASVRKALIVLGYRSDGFIAFELFPETYADMIASTAAQVNSLAGWVEADGRRFCLVVLPYEMQISEEAESVYSSVGVEWGPEFVDRGTQKALIESLDPGIEYFDAYYAFVDEEDPQAARSVNGLGEYYVSMDGGSLDWNHLNRRGHQRMAEALSEAGFCGLGGSASISVRSAPEQVRSSAADDAG